MAEHATGDEPIAYPYGASPLLPAWGSHKSWALAGLAVACSSAGAWVGTLRGWAPNEVALLAVLPGMLAFTLAFAPEPRTRLGTMAKDLLCLGTCAGALAGHHAHLLIVGVPALLGLAATMDRLLPPGFRVPQRHRIQASGRPR